MSTTASPSNRRISTSGVPVPLPISVNPRLASNSVNATTSATGSIGSSVGGGGAGAGVDRGTSPRLDTIRGSPELGPRNTSVSSAGSSSGVTSPSFALSPVASVPVASPRRNLVIHAHQDTNAEVIAALERMNAAAAANNQYSTDAAASQALSPASIQLSVLGSVSSSSSAEYRDLLTKLEENSTPLTLTFTAREKQLLLESIKKSC